jgi:tetratricopeptide (TPR) repeat protein
MALDLHRQGLFAAAESAYQDVLKAAPGHVGALHLLGVLAGQCGDFHRSAELIRQALARDPHNALAHGNLGLALKGLGRREAALASFDTAIALKPDHAEAHMNRGSVLYQLGHFGAALQSFDSAIALNRHLTQAYFQRGNLYQAMNRPALAIADYDRALSLKENFPEAHCNRGVVLDALGRFDAALVSLNRALALKPDWPETYCSRSKVLRACERFEEAIADCDQAIALQPDLAEAYSNRGAIYNELNRSDQALADYERAIRLNEGAAAPWANRGVLLMELHRLDESLASFGEAIARDPGLIEAHVNRAMAHLLAGDYERGWPEYEWRHNIPDRLAERHARGLVTRPWLGDEDVAGRRILLRGEQGLGDCLQFCRYAKLVAAAGATVFLEVPQELKSLLGNLEGVTGVLSPSDALPACDFFTPLLSLPLAFKTNLDTIPAQMPYLASDPVKRLRWRESLGEKTRLRVGLVWSGGSRPGQPASQSMSRRRNVPLALLAPLAHPDIEFYSLQKGQPAEAELAELRAGDWDGPELIDQTALLQDFSDTAALIDALDLVVSVDTSTAHLAAALGKPVWLLNRFDTCWRWLLDRTDSPWYPTMTLYRQRRMGDWSDVIEAVSADLHRLAGRRA